MTCTGTTSGTLPPTPCTSIMKVPEPSSADCGRTDDGGRDRHELVLDQGDGAGGRVVAGDEGTVDGGEGARERAGVEHEELVAVGGLEAAVEGGGDRAVERGSSRHQQAAVGGAGRGAGHRELQATGGALGEGATGRQASEAEPTAMVPSLMNWVPLPPRVEVPGAVLVMVAPAWLVMVGGVAPVPTQ